MAKVSEDGAVLSETFSPIAVAAANEGVPISAIARMLQTPYDIVHRTLIEARDAGWITTVPLSDWPPTANRNDRKPMFPATTSRSEVILTLRHLYTLTNLEAAFLFALLTADRVEKGKLHNIVEQQRMARGSLGAGRDATDPKMVDVMICKLRKKLKTIDTGFVITTIWGGGYHLQPDTRAKITTHIHGVANGPDKKDTASASAPGRGRPGAVPY